MFFEVFRFECRYQLRSPLFLIVAGVWFLLGFLITGSESVRVGGVGNNLNLNASFAIIQVQYVLSMIGMFAAVAFVATAITRDYETKTAELFFSTGVSEKSFLFGRFAGGFTFATIAVFAGMLGSMVGTFMPWLDPERIGPFSIDPYVFSVWAVTVPNMFVTCGLFFAVAALSRSMMAAYSAALFFLSTFVVVANVTDQESIEMVALGGPFGQVAFGEITRYWTVFDRNFAVPEFSGTLLYNRLIWIGLSVLALLLTALRYRFNLAPSRSRLKRIRKKPASAPSARDFSSEQSFDFGTGVRQFVSQLRMDVRGVSRSIPFYVVLAFGILNVTGGFYGALSQIYGTEVYPVTAIMTQVVGSNFSFVVLIVLIYYSGELVHRERQTRVAEFLDAAPFPGGIMVLSKVGAMWFVVSALYLIVALTAMVVQTLNGYSNYEIGLYATQVFGAIGGSFYLWAVAAVLVQVLSPNKFFGMIAVLLIFLGLSSLNSFGFEHVLYSFGLPAMTYSDMNGYGHFVEPFVTIAAYWLCFCVLLVLAAHLLFRRGNQIFSERLASARQRISPSVIAVGALAALAMSVLGGWIYYNTNVLNEYVTQDDLEEAQADYEKAYKQFRGLPRLEALDLSFEVDVFPDERRLESRGAGVLTNLNEEPVSEVHLSLSPLLRVNSIELSGAELVAEDTRLGYYKYRFDPALAPASEITFSWDLSWINEGFTNSGSTTSIVENGTFVNNAEIMPTLGYDSGRELGDNGVRREYDLAPVERLPQLGDPAWLGVNQLGVGTRSGFRAVVSTVEDQIAIAPGYLQKEWVENGRRYFEYAMDDKIWPFASFLSARYEVAEDTWNDVNLEVYYDAKHPFNVDAMINGSKKALAYFTREFSPYQYRQFRILEFPSYQSFAQSFPNTIPYSEAIGFIADLRDEENIDYVFYVTAHELAHQWWAHQVIGARMQGMTVIVETLAQYSALMVMEKEYGVERMRRFLKYELDNYLQSRGSELIEELPLMYVENQGYIHYRKGSVAMYALKDAIGEDKVNAALRSFISQYGFKERTFPTSRDLLQEFRAVAGAEHQELITDLFEKIILFDLKVVDATFTSVGDEYEVEIKVSAAKLEADGQGSETEVPLSYQLDLAVFPEDPEDLGEDDLPDPLLIEKRLVTDGDQTFTFRVSERPGRVAIDPYNKMIDRNPDDNLRRL
jgi:ABC-2 type transport system permease protein